MDYHTIKSKAREHGIEITILSFINGSLFKNLIKNVTRNERQIFVSERQSNDKTETNVYGNVFRTAFMIKQVIMNQITGM